MVDERANEAQANSDNQAAELKDGELDQAAGGWSYPPTKRKCKKCGHIFISSRVMKCPNCLSTEIETINPYV